MLQAAREGHCCCRARTVAWHLENGHLGAVSRRVCIAIVPYIWVRSCRVNCRCSAQVGPQLSCSPNLPLCLWHSSQPHHHIVLELARGSTRSPRLTGASSAACPARGEEEARNPPASARQYLFASSARLRDSSVGVHAARNLRVSAAELLLLLLRGKLTLTLSH
jgi:hypothetical protein